MQFLLSFLNYCLKTPKFVLIVELSHKIFILNLKKTMQKFCLLHTSLSKLGFVNTSWILSWICVHSMTSFFKIWNLKGKSNKFLFLFVTLVCLNCSMIWFVKDVCSNSLTILFLSHQFPLLMLFIVLDWCYFVTPVLVGTVLPDCWGPSHLNGWSFNLCNGIVTLH